MAFRPLTIIFLTLFFTLSTSGNEKKYFCQYTATVYSNREKRRDNYEYEYDEETVTTKTFKYLVSVSSFSPGGGWVICGGVLITQSRIITAAHCVVFAKEAEHIIAGAGNIINGSLYFNERKKLKFFDSVDSRLGIMEIAVRYKHIHPLFDYYNCTNDIAILDLKYGFPKNLRTHKGKISYGVKITENMCLSFGWSSPKEAGRMERPLTCGYTLLTARTVKGNHLCMYSEIFQSGFPLICEDEIYGISSYYPGVCVMFVNFQTSRDWIHSLKIFETKNTSSDFGQSFFITLLYIAFQTTANFHFYS